MQMWARKQTRMVGFTIVELLIVVVVIAILAAITIVAYNGIQNRAKESALQSTVSQAGKKVASIGIQNADIVPLDKAAFLAATNLSDSSAATYTYYANDAARSYCVSAVSTGTISPYAYSSDGGVAEKGECSMNLVTNPGMEAGVVSGYGPRYSATLARVTTEARSGSASLRVITPGSVADEGVNMSATAGTVSPGFAGTFTGSAWVKAPAGAPLRLFLEEISSANAYVAGSTQNFTATGSWQRISVSRTVTDPTRKFVVNVRTNSVNAVTFYVDDVMITAGSSLYEYGDGSSSKWKWMSTENASASFGPALAQ